MEEVGVESKGRKEDSQYKIGDPNGPNGPPMVFLYFISFHSPLPLERGWG